MDALLDKPHTVQATSVIPVEKPGIRFVVRARCDREVHPHSWKLEFTDGTETHITYGVITSVKFSCNFRPGGGGCAGGAYEGYAKGTFDPMEKISSRKQGRKLYFDRGDGEFYENKEDLGEFYENKEDLELPPLQEAYKLLLLPECKAVFFLEEDFKRKGKK